jgi:hypothetical protein
MIKIVCIGAFATNIEAIINCAPPEKTNNETNVVKIQLNPAACSKIPHANPIGM